VVFSAPEFVEAQAIEVGHKPEVALELERGAFA
jgi:hypothetical protein